ncbi:hypothetical protein [Krasilnikovia sp. M28-CT-15]
MPMAKRENTDRRETRFSRGCFETYGFVEHSVFRTPGKVAFLVEHR